MPAVPLSQTAVIPGTSRRVLAVLLPQTVAMRKAFAADLGKPLVITDGWRSYDEQVDLFARYYTTTPQPGRPTRVFQGRTWWQRPGFPSAAVPGSGFHPAGRALDLGSGVNTSLTSPEHRWMRENGPRYGWVHPTWAHDGKSSNGTDEPWHFEAGTTAIPVSNYLDTSTSAPNLTTPNGALPGALTPEDDMFDTDDRHRLETVQGQLDAVLAALRIPGDPAGTTYPAATHNAIGDVLTTVRNVNRVVSDLTPLIEETQERVRGQRPEGDVLQLLTAAVADLNTAVQNLKRP